jgi:anti-sigma factor RsiW
MAWVEGFTLWRTKARCGRRGFSTVCRGMAISYWNDGHEEYWVASRMPAPALPGFVQALRAGSTPDAG